MSSAVIDFNGILGTNLELPCTPPKGKPDPVVRWKKNGSPLDLGSKRIGIDSRGHLRVRGLRGGDEGNYSCVASNMAGVRESKSIALRVLSELQFQ
jgi:roundabout axon guidance receptor 2